MHHPVGIYIEYISVVITATLWGLTCVQTFQYFVYHHRRDHLLLKLLVIFLWICDTLNTAFLSHGFWRVIDNNVSPITIEKLVSDQFLPELLALQRNSFSLGEYGDSALDPVGDPSSYYLFQLPSICFLVFLPLRSSVNTDVHSQNPGSTISSESVTKLLEFIWAEERTHLRGGRLSPIKLKLRTEECRMLNAYYSTTQILHSLSIVIVNTGLWTSLIILLSLVGEAQDVYAALSFTTSPLYCNTLLANLNTRDYVQKGLFQNSNELRRHLSFCSKIILRPNAIRFP
ncbi:hypothetical protein EDD85DRAFT_1029368 [Armillaria nabsnona]|nr:hypothetical protein EDD85DRAFT_1029368 [Armillaria nabsnona]